ncbi:hypothetical protein EMPG_11803 [Blastomyces silverae]|uniref:Aminoglycoside phosphotransferase domain-containing protein n=1 Tax=Blastomyces silverae TaxID=2060906 RepID=A0A0H1BPG2_9EURO|nr:hypothetical protein EMPG_11803 [Blastomyces silverae]
MSVIPDVPLTEAWDSLDDTTEKRVCVETWSMIEKPAVLQHHFLCLADGSPCINDPIVARICCAEHPHPPLLNDDAVCARIYECYYAAKEIAKNIGPHNIMFDQESLRITGIIDWEVAGWYPDYWEYSSIMKRARCKDW